MNDEQNPYRPPEALTYAPPAAATEATGERSVALYTRGQVTLATFFGTAIAGAIIMSINYRRLGSPKVAGTMVLGFVITALAIFAAFMLPDNFPGLILNIGVLVIMNRIAESAQGATVGDHLEAGGARGSS